MKLPRGVSGDRLIRTLQKVGYSIVRQKGSHVRLEHPGPPAHRVTVPLRNPLKTGQPTNLNGAIPCSGHS
jgi:predicted RNA binding protein YcfA (HicA-like mRNA interferase family)